VPRVFRVVSYAEYEDIRISGLFRPGIGTMEGKWFADTYRGVLKHSARLYPDGDFLVVAVDIPNTMHRRLSRRDNLDQFGPATWLELSDLGLVAPILEFEVNDA
jgi:hypothetical protein